MIEFITNIQKYKLQLAEEIYLRLRLINNKGELLTLVHEDKKILEALYLEILDRYRVREIAHLQKQAKWSAKVISFWTNRKTLREDMMFKEWIIAHCQ